MIPFRLIRLISSRFRSSIKGNGFLSFSKAVAFISVMLGSMALVIALSVLGGFDQSLHNIAATFTSHIQVHSSLSGRFHHADEIARRVQNVSSEIQYVVPVLQSEALIMRRGNTEGIILKSEYPSAKRTLVPQLRRLKSGSWPAEESGRRDILLGANLARRLDCTTGDTVFVSFAPGGFVDANSVVTLRFNVSGIYESGMTQYDDQMVYTTYTTLNDIVSPESPSASHLELWLHDAAHADKVARAIEQSFGFRLSATSMEEIHRGMFAWIEMQKQPVPIVLGLISIVAVFNLLTTLLISIVEKSSSYAVLLTLGLQTRDLLISVVWQGLMIGASGAVAGCAIALGLSLLQQQFGILHLDGSIYFVDKVPVSIVPWHYVVVLVVSISLSILATLIPGVIASRIPAITALRFK